MAITTNGGAGITADAVATLSNKTLEAPVINNATFTGAQAGLEIKFGNNIVLEGTTDNAFEMTLSGGDPTADRTITLPDVTGTVVTTGNLSAITTLTSPTITGAVFNDGSVVFEGTTANDFETTLAITDPTADRTITFPDLTGTVALTSGVINNTLTTTTGDTIYASSANTPARLAIGTAGQTLTVSAGGIPEWATPAAGTTANDQAFAFAVQVFA
jgi:hypothetical protein